MSSLLGKLSGGCAEAPSPWVGRCLSPGRTEAAGLIRRDSTLILTAASQPYVWLSRGD